MNREVHVRFWESPEVKVLRATRHSRRFRDVGCESASPPRTDIVSETGHVGYAAESGSRSISDIATGHCGIKQCRRVATQCDKLAVNYLAAIRTWLRDNKSTL